MDIATRQMLLDLSLRGGDAQAVKRRSRFRNSTAVRPALAAPQRRRGGMRNRHRPRLVPSIALHVATYSTILLLAYPAHVVPSQVGRVDL